MKFLAKLIILIILVIIGIGVWVWSGAYNIAADAPHWSFTRYAIGQLRERSIDVRADKVKIPASVHLDDPALIAEGAHHYAEMCTGCHLAPGISESELREGLYPKPPNLTRFAPRPTEAFWIIKHGIKMTAMPAWGKTHDDQKIWAMVAYLQKQPHMSVAHYRELTHSAAADPMLMHEGASHMPAPAASSAAPAPAPAASVPRAPAA